MRLSIEITQEQYQQVKELANQYGKTIDEYILDKILPVDEREVIKKLGNLLMRRLEVAKREAFSTKTVDEILEERMWNARE